MRREIETQQALSVSAEARKLQSEFQQVITPYVGLIQAEGAEPMQAVASLLQTSALLRTAPPQQKAQVVAKMIQQFGVDLRSLDQSLAELYSGQAPTADPMQAVIQALDQRLKPVMDFMGTVQSTRTQAEQQMRSEAEQEWIGFMNDPANEFAADVAGDMADLLMAAAKRGRVMGLPEAYRAATLAHPTISGLVRSRQQAEGQAQQTAAARRALEAAASLPSNGGAPTQNGSGDQSDGSVRGDILASMTQLQQRSR
jgi:hypothetical protein